MIKIGVFGGSFDPIHRSHVRVIEESIRQLKLDKILVMPTANNPWKDSTGATKQQRLAMLEIALKRLIKMLKFAVTRLIKIVVKKLYDRYN